MVVGEFTKIENVKRLARLTNEVPDDELQEFIESVNQEILREHGYPVARMRSDISTSYGSYYLNTNREPVYKIDRVIVDGSLLSEGSWTGNSGSASVAIPSDILTNKSGKAILVDYIPYIYHQLATFKAAKDVIESQYLVSSEGGEFPRTAWLTTRIKDILETLPNSPMYRSSEYSSWSPESGTYVDQSLLGNNL